MGSYLAIQGDCKNGLTYLQKGLEISEQQGLSLFKPLINFNLVFCHICCGDLDRVQYALDNSFSDISPKQRMLVSLLHFYTAWNYALNNQLTHALEQA